MQRLPEGVAGVPAAPGAAGVCHVCGEEEEDEDDLIVQARGGAEEEAGRQAAPRVGVGALRGGAPPAGRRQALRMRRPSPSLAHCRPRLAEPQVPRPAALHAPAVQQVPHVCAHELLRRGAGAARPPLAVRRLLAGPRAPAALRAVPRCDAAQRRRRGRERRLVGHLLRSPSCPELLLAHPCLPARHPPALSPGRRAQAQHVRAVGAPRLRAVAARDQPGPRGALPAPAGPGAGPGQGKRPLLPLLRCWLGGLGPWGRGRTRPCGCNQSPPCLASAPPPAGAQEPVPADLPGLQAAPRRLRPVLRAALLRGVPPAVRAPGGVPHGGARWGGGQRAVLPPGAALPLPRSLPHGLQAAAERRLPPCCCDLLPNLPALPCPALPCPACITDDVRVGRGGCRV